MKEKRSCKSRVTRNCSKKRGKMRENFAREMIFFFAFRSGKVAETYFGRRFRFVVKKIKKHAENRFLHEHGKFDATLKVNCDQANARESHASCETFTADRDEDRQSVDYAEKRSS